MPLFSDKPLFSDDTNDKLAAIGAGLLSGGTWQQQLGNAAANLGPVVQQQRETNRTLAYLDKFAPDIAQRARAGLPLGMALQEYAQARKPKTPEYGYMNIDGRVIRTDKTGGTIQDMGNFGNPDAKLPASAQENRYWMTHPDEYTAYQQRQLQLQKDKDAPSSQDRFKNELDTMKTYRGEDDVKTYQGTRDAYEKVRTSATLGTAQGDIGLIYGFMKMLDPTSVVREGEYATAQNSGGISDSILNTYNKLLSGQRLTPDQRQQFVDAAGKQYENTVTNLGRVNERYSGLADQYGVPTERFVERPKTYEPLKLGDPPTDITLPDGTNGKIKRTR